MTYAERQQADRRATAIADWRRLGRRAEDRRRFDNARVAAWLDTFHAARAALVTRAAGVV
jgi:hypothetical protein